MGFSAEQNRPCVWPRRPHLPTPQHTCSQWGLCNAVRPQTYSCPPPPPKQETRICRALVFLLISCFAAPSPDYFLNFFLVPLRLDIPNQLFVRVHLETSCSRAAVNINEQRQTSSFIKTAAIWNERCICMLMIFPLKSWTITTGSSTAFNVPRFG